MKRKMFFLNVFFIFLFVSPNLFGQEILINTNDGEMFTLEVDLEESLGSLKDKIISFAEGKDQIILIEIPGEGELAMNFMMTHQGGYLGFPRNYHVGVNQAERTDIRYIVTFLANKSLISIAMAKPELEAAGDRIDHVHPLRFLETVFTDEELKVGIRNIRGKGWVWNHFVSGLKESLETEFNIGNVESFVNDFAKNVGIEERFIIGLITSKKWEDFIDALIQKIPRKGDQDRYDCCYN